MNTAWALAASVALLAANGFFVAAEFALVAARRHRLADLAAAGSRAARLAVRGTRQLTVTLAGAQLGITLCTLGLGALAKPAVADLLRGPLAAAGLPAGAAYGVALLIAIAVVVFLHMVVGEMAPKSWAISHPERSALTVAPPFEGYIAAVRPLLRALNAAANLALRAAKVVPRDELADPHDPEDLRILLRRSRDDGLLAEQQHRILDGVLNLRDRTVAPLLRPARDVVTVAAGAGNEEIERVSRASGRSRLVVLDRGRPTGVVHIRDALKHPAAGAADLAAAPLLLTADTPVAQAVGRMRRERAQLALVTDGDGRLGGLVSLEDLLEQILGDFEDETDDRNGGHSPE